jgi:hypothetical protein
MVHRWAKRDELRNAAVLAWYLDPRGSHGFGAAELHDFLAEVARRTPGWPNLCGDLSRVTVVTEEWPRGSETDRVDISGIPKKLSAWRGCFL